MFTVVTVTPKVQGLQTPGIEHPASIYDALPEDGPGCSGQTARDE